MLTTTNNLPIRVDDLVVEGGAVFLRGEIPRGRFLSSLTGSGKVRVTRPRHDEKGRLLVDAKGRSVWDDEEEGAGPVPGAQERGRPLPT